MKEKKLIKAHIIPDFMYSGMKEEDDKNIFLEVTYNLDKNTRKQRKIQTGIFDKNILCEDCDNGIIGGQYEKYAQNSMYGKNIDPEIAPICKNYKNPNDGFEYSICKNIDYGKFKIFLLSILWRASITDQKIFKDVDLGNSHEESLRRIIFENMIPNEDEYPIMMTSFMRTENSLKNFIGQPKRIRFNDGLNGYVFLINSIQFMFYVNSINHKLPIYLKKTMLKKSGEMTVLHLPNGKELEFLKLLLNK
ncbi:hypothetical protein [Maribacter litoralis]|uniref:hypothetical protein n=1 Tax=Maribacter litoralis TaxID=2059726 RepID=UPI0013DFF40C|nr:hypothetical protein [Maribacter litoralis]